MSEFSDRTEETTTSTGTGDLTTSGTAPTGSQTINAGIGQNIHFSYAIIAVDGSGNPSGEWETGIGYMSSATNLVRAFPRTGSAALPVNFSAGTKQVLATLISENVISKGLGLAMALNLGRC